MSMRPTTIADLWQHVRGAGFAYADEVIHLFVGGSELHGAKVQGTDDLDIYGAYIEPPATALGLDPTEHFVWSTAGDERRNGPDDVDITLYSLRKWARLAVKGNPTALHFLFAPGLGSPAWQFVVSHRDLFLARSAACQFTGFAHNQLQRMTGERGRGKKGQRPELENRFGYDVKAAMHAIRLLHECRELLQEGCITLPRPERDFLIRVRTGEFAMAEVLRIAEKLFSDCANAEKTSPLPAVIDRDAVSRLVAEAYQAHWAASR